jgi:hypothetical protein
MRDEILAHEAMARRNAARADTYEQSFPSDPAWAIVLRFYAALHLTQAYLLTKAAHFHAHDHGSRWRAIRSSPELRPNFRDAYSALYSASQNVRYVPVFLPTPQNLAESVANLRVVRGTLDGKIQAWLAKNP